MYLASSSFEKIPTTFPFLRGIAIRGRKFGQLCVKFATFFNDKQSNERLQSVAICMYVFFSMFKFLTTTC